MTFNTAFICVIFTTICEISDNFVWAISMFYLVPGKKFELVTEYCLIITEMLNIMYISKQLIESSCLFTFCQMGELHSHQIQVSKMSVSFSTNCWSGWKMHLGRSGNWPV